MLYKVPQKIDLEDKVIGPLTFRQFLYLLAGFLPSFIIGEILQSTVGWNLIVGILICFPLWIPALFLAFAKFQEQNIDQVLVAMLNFIRMPKSLIWDKRSETPKVLIKAPKKTTITYGRPKSLESRLQNLSESMSIYGVTPEANSDRIIAQKAKTLVIKTKIKSVRAIPNEERSFLPEKEMQKELGPNHNQTTQTTSTKQPTEKSDIIGKGKQPEIKK